MKDDKQVNAVFPSFPPDKTCIMGTGKLIHFVSVAFTPSTGSVCSIRNKAFTSWMERKYSSGKIIHNKPCHHLFDCFNPLL